MSIVPIIKMNILYLKWKTLEYQKVVRSIGLSRFLITNDSFTFIPFFNLGIRWLDCAYV